MVCPAAIITLAGETVKVDGLLLDRLTVTPPDGAAVPRITGNAAD